jgi:hypothetical protein
MREELDASRRDVLDPDMRVRGGGSASGVAASLAEATAAIFSFHAVYAPVCRRCLSGALSHGQAQTHSWLDRRDGGSPAWRVVGRCSPRLTRSSGAQNPLLVALVVVLLTALGAASRHAAGGPIASGWRDG